MPEAESQPRRTDGSADVDPASLVHRARSGDREAWETLVGLYARRIYAAAISSLRNPDAAEEVTQSVMASVYETISKGRYEEHGSFESWLFRIAMNRVRDAARRRTRDRRLTTGLRLQAADADRSLGGAAPDDAAGHGEDLEAMRRAIASMPPPDQEIISLRHHAGLSFPQISDLLGSPMGTVLARHHRALAKLRGMLQESDEGQTP